MHPVLAGAIQEVRSIPEQISRSANYVPWYWRMILEDGIILEEQVRGLDLQKSLKLFRTIDATLKHNPEACLHDYIANNSDWRYLKYSDQVRAIPHVILLEWADVLLELLKEEQSKRKTAMRVINELDLGKETIKDEPVWQNSLSTSAASSQSSLTSDECLTKILGEIAFAVDLDYESVSPSKLIKKIEHLFAFASKSFETLKSMDGTHFEPDFETYLSKAEDVEGDLSSFKNAMLASLEYAKEDRSLFVNGLMVRNENLTRNLAETRDLLSRATMVKADLEQDRLDTIEALSPVVSVIGSSSLVPAVQILVKKANSPVNESTENYYHDRLLKGEKKISSLKAENEEQRRIVQVSLIVANQVESELADLYQKLDRQQMTIQELEDEDKNLPNKEISLVEEEPVDERDLDSETENLLKSLEEYKQLLARKQKENEDLQALVKELKSPSQQQTPVVRYIYPSSSSSSSSSVKTPEPTKQPALLASHTFTEADIHRAVLAERATIPERCRVVGTANIAMFGSSLTLFAAGSGLIGYWYYMLRPVLALI